MKALTHLRSAINQGSILSIVALILIAPFACPVLTVQAAGLQTSGQPALVFDVKTTLQNQNSISLLQITQHDPLTASLHNYLVSYNSPLADYTNQLLSKDNWKMILAISFVESNMGVHHYYYNSSGIGGQEYLRKYHNYGEWIDDMSNLLATRYNGWTLEKMDGVYVQPYSYNWALGSKKILAELTALENNAATQRANIALTGFNTTPELAINK